MKKGIIWVVLTEESKQQLLHIASPIYSHLFAHHVTLKYGDIDEASFTAYLNKTYEIRTVANCWNGQIQAVLVDIGNLPCQNTYPHITISAREGVEPVESNVMLSSHEKQQQALPLLKLSGTVEIHYFHK